MRPRLPAAVLLGIVGALVAGAAVIGAEGGPSGPSSASVFAQRLGGWGDTLGVEGVVGAHAFYLYDEPRATVARYVETHLPPGAVLSGYGTNSGVVTVVTETLAVSGPNEYLAMLTYQVAATKGSGTQSELRIDAKTIWEPSRPAAERAPSDDSVQVTGYGYFVRTLPRRPVTVVLRPTGAQPLVRAFDSLPLGPGPPECLGDTTYFELVISPPAGGGPTFRVGGDACGAEVGVAQDGTAVAYLSDQSCALLHAVGAALPASASATKHMAAMCSSGRKRKGLSAPSFAAEFFPRAGPVWAW